LAETTITGRVTVADRYLRTLMVEDRLRVELLGPQSVVDFVLDASRRYTVGSMKVLTVSLRSLLRYLFAVGVVDRDLSRAVPSVAGWRIGALPPTPGEDVLAALLAACDRSRPVGLRDNAVLLLMARLGLRSAEIADLRLDDLDWRSGEVVVRGKGGRVDRLLAKKSWITCLTALFHWLPASQSYCRRRSPRRRRVRPGRPTAGARHGAEGSLNSVWKASKPRRCSTRRRAAVRGPKPWRWSKLGEPSQQRVHLALVGRVLDRYSSTVKHYQSVDDYWMDAFGSEKR
jgi:integrase